MFESLTIPLIIIIISIMVFDEFKLSGIEYILIIFYAGLFVVLGMMVGMIKDYLLRLKRNPERKSNAIFLSSANQY